VIYFATVTRVDGTSIYVRVPDLDRTRDCGPLEGLEGLTLAAGDRVLVGGLYRPAGEIVLIRRLP
jgi:hypothetical protein